MHDLKNKADIEILVNSFYDKVIKDDKIGPVFHNLTGSNRVHYLSAMCDFWNMALFSKPGYGGNPTGKHVEIDQNFPLQQEHFDRWLLIWNQTVNSLYQGETANLAKTRATLMADLINSRIKTERGKKK